MTVWEPVIFFYEPPGPKKHFSSEFVLSTCFVASSETPRSTAEGTDPRVRNSDYALLGVDAGTLTDIREVLPPCLLRTHHRADIIKSATPSCVGACRLLHR